MSGFYLLSNAENGQLSVFYGEFYFKTCKFKAVNSVVIVISRSWVLLQYLSKHVPFVVG